jgi:SAM-dependent methyltransferase
VGKESATARDFLGHLEMIRKGSKSEVKVLGLSSGAAEDELFLARQGYQVLATDVAVEKMDKVISAATSEGVRMKGYKVDVTQKLPFADGEFDAVYWRLGAHYMTNQQLRDFAYELNRVMRSGGILYVVANSKDDPNYVQFGGRGNADGMVTFQDSFADRKLSRNFFNEQDLNDLFSPFFKSYSITKHKEQLKHTSNFLIFAATKGDKVGGGVDKSQRSHLGKNTGGIDLNPSKIDMTTKSQGEGVEFNLDPAILKRMQDASGVTPVIIGIHPLDNLYQFFEIPPPIPSPQGGGR